MDDILKKPKSGLEPELLPENPNRTLTEEEKKKINYSNSSLKTPPKNYIKESWSDIDAKKEPEPDDLMSIYKKYIKPPKENKETENSLRRLAIGEAISKGIAGVGNMFSGKPTQYDSQPMSNTYLKSIEAADERRKRFDAQNHDYVGGMYNTAVDSWKYNKGQAAQKAKDDEDKRRWEAEFGLKGKALEYKNEQEKGKIAARIKAAQITAQKTAGKKLSTGSFVVARDPNGIEIKFGNDRVSDIYNYAKRNGAYAGKLEAELSQITDPAVKVQLVKNWVVEAIQKNDNIAEYASQHQEAWVKDLEATNKYVPNISQNNNTQPTSTEAVTNNSSNDPLGIR